MSNDMHGEIVIIKRNGTDGARYPLKASRCIFGRNPDCDIRIQIPNVAQEHAMICVEDGKIMLKNLSENIPTLLNGREVSIQDVKHNDIFTITERSFRFEFPDRRKSSTPRRLSSSKKTPLRALQGSPRTPAAGESLKKSITKLRRTSATVLEVDESALTPKNGSSKKSTPKSSIQQKENTPEDELLPGTPSILKTKPSTARRESGKKRVSFGGDLSPELFDKTLPPSTPLRKGTSPARRLSEPLQKITPGVKSGKKRFSLGNTLGEMPILEEDEEAKDDGPVFVPNEGTSVPEALCDTPPQSLPAPLLPTTTDITEDVTSPEVDPEAVKEQDAEQAPAEVTNVGEDSGLEEKPSITPTRKTKRASMFRAQRLATPIRQQIHAGITFRITKRKMQTPLRKEIQSKHELRKTMKKIATPLRKEIQNAPALNKVMKSMPTPIRKEIQNKPELKATKKKLATPLRRQIQEKPALRVTKKKLATPLRQDIKMGVALRVTKKKLQTPLRGEIKEGVKLRKTKPTLATPLREEIKSKPQLRETKKRMRQDLQKEIVEGKVLQSKFKDLPKLPADVKTELAEGKVLNKTLKSAPTPFKNEIKQGVKLRETKRKMRQSLQSEIISGTKLRKTKRSAPTPLRKEIEEGKELQKTKKTAPTPFRKEIEKGVKLRKTKKKLDSAIQDEIKQGIALKKTKIAAPTPFRNEIKKGVKLRQAKKKLNENLQKEIKDGKVLNKTKKTAPTPFRNEIKKGVTLRQTKKKLDKELQKEIKEGKELKKTKKTAPTPFRNEIKKGVKLRATKKRMSMSLQSQIRAGTSLIPLMRKSLKTPIRAQIRAGTNLRKNVKRIATPQKEQIEARRKSLRSATKESSEGSIEPVIEPAVIEAHKPQNTTRTILKAKRRLGNQTKVMHSVVPEIPRRLSEKIEKPAKKRVCRRSTPKKIAELRDQFEFVDPYEEHDTAGTEESIPMSTEEADIMSPVIEVQAVKNPPASCPAQSSFSDTWLSETSFEEESAGEGFVALCKMPSLAQAEPAKDTSRIANEASAVVQETLVENSPVEGNLGLARLMKTPKSAKRGGEIDGDFGTRRLMKTPKEVKRCEVVEEHFGTKRLLKTPKEAKKSEPVEAHFGTKRLMTTPKEAKSEAVAEHFGTKRLFTTPKQPMSSQPVEEHFGTRRLMRTPKDRATADPMVTNKFGLTRLMATPKDRSEKDHRYSIEIGTLPSMFREGRGNRQEPMNEMQLQDLFVEIEPCCLQDAAVGDCREDEAKASPESDIAESTKEPNMNSEACEVAKQSSAEGIQEVVFVKETRKTRRTTRGGMQRVAEIVTEMKPARQTRRGKKAKIAEPVEVAVMEEECGNGIVEESVRVDTANSEEMTASALPVEPAEQMEAEAAEQTEAKVIESESRNKAVNKIIVDGVVGNGEESATMTESCPISINHVESTIEPALMENAHDVVKEDAEVNEEVVFVKETRMARRTTRGGMQKAVEVTIGKVKPARQTRRGRKAKVAEPIDLEVVEEECRNEVAEKNVKGDATKRDGITASVLSEAEADSVTTRPVRQTRRGRKVKAAQQVKETATEEEGPKVAVEMVAEDRPEKEGEPTPEIMVEEAEPEPVVSKPVKQTRRGKRGKAALQVEEIGTEEETPKEALELIVQGVACKIQEKAEFELVSEEAEVEPVVSKPVRQSRRGRRSKAVQSFEEETSKEDSTAKQMKEITDAVVPEKAVSKPTRQTRRQGKQDEVAHPIDNTVNEIESTSEVPLGRRATRGKKFSAPEKPALRRGRRGSVAMTTTETGEMICGVNSKEADDKQESIEKEIACKPEQISRPNRSRKSVEEVVQRISRKRSAEQKEASNEEEKIPEPSQGAKKRAGRKKKIQEEVLTSDERCAAGAVKGVVVTPEKMQLKKVKLVSIPEETASQIGTPLVDIAQIEEEAEKVELVPVTKVARRTKRGRKRGADAIEQGDSVCLSEPPSKRRVSTRQTRSKRS